MQKKNVSTIFGGETKKLQGQANEKYRANWC